MSNSHQIVLFHDGEIFSPYYFYNRFLPEIAEFYQDSNDNTGNISYKLIPEEDFVTGRYRIDPIAIPLFLSLSQQIAIRQKQPIWLDISNIPSTIGLLEFLYRSDFFFVSGNNTIPCFPKGKKILAFKEEQIGGFQGKSIRPEHKIRCYSGIDADENNPIAQVFENEEEKRDYLVEHYSYEVSNHFQPLLQEFTNENVYFYIEILSELIANGVMHSGTDVFALMFSDRFSTKFSIADNGVGFATSLSKKEDTPYYKKYELENQILNDFKLPSNEVIKALLSIFEALFFSMTKSRLGLFDLVLSVVCDHFGYFRLHNDTAQVIVSARMLDELTTLNVLRKRIRKIYSLKDYGKIEDAVFDQKMRSIICDGKAAMMALFQKMWENYNEDVRFSSVRFFPVRFRGVHIEAEIPK